MNSLIFNTLSAWLVAHVDFNLRISPSECPLTPSFEKNFYHNDKLATYVRFDVIKRGDTSFFCDDDIYFEDNCKLINGDKTFVITNIGNNNGSQYFVYFPEEQEFGVIYVETCGVELLVHHAKGDTVEDIDDMIVTYAGPREQDLRESGDVPEFLSCNTVRHVRLNELFAALSEDFDKLPDSVKNTFRNKSN